MIRTDICVCVCRWLIPQTEVGQITWWSRGSFLWQGWRFPDNVGGVEASCFRQVGAGRWQRVKDKVSGGTETSLCSLLCTESRTLQCVAPGLSCPVLSCPNDTAPATRTLPVTDLRNIFYQRLQLSQKWLQVQTLSCFPDMWPMRQRDCFHQDRKWCPVGQCVKHDTGQQLETSFCLQTDLNPVFSKHKSNQPVSWSLQELWGTPETSQTLQKTHDRGRKSSFSVSDTQRDAAQGSASMMPLKFPSADISEQLI